MATATLDADPDNQKDRVRQKLRELGARRTSLEADDKELTDEIKDALREAEGKVPTAEAARLLGVHRTTLYRVYK